MAMSALALLISLILQVIFIAFDQIILLYILARVFFERTKI